MDLDDHNKHIDYRERKLLGRRDQEISQAASNVARNARDTKMEGGKEYVDEKSKDQVDDDESQKDDQKSSLPETVFTKIDQAARSAKEAIKETLLDQSPKIDEHVDQKDQEKDEEKRLDEQEEAKKDDDSKAEQLRETIICYRLTVMYHITSDSLEAEGRKFLEEAMKRMSNSSGYDTFIITVLSVAVCLAGYSLYSSRKTKAQSIKVQEKVYGLKERVSSTNDELLSKITEAAQYINDIIRENSQSLGNKVMNQVEETKNQTPALYEQASSKLGQAIQSIKDYVQGAYEDLEQNADHAKSKKVMDKAQQRAQQGADMVKEEAG